MSTTKRNWKVLVIAQGFYYFGEQVDAPDGYIALKDGAMFGGFSGGKGVAGVCRGDPAAKVTLDRFAEGELLYFPVTSCHCIQPSVNLYTFKGTTLR